MAPSFLALQRLRVMRHGRPVYDQSFHLGVNIIRGENGSGKSTIADFIFYILGGEFDDWKSAASLCEEVQAEIATRGGVITVRRPIGSKQTAPFLFFGPMQEAENHALDGWQQLPIRRSGSSESYSQILFRAAGIPEAQSYGASNVTMHQILRLLYSDQRTPAARLFRFETFDNHDIREAVGNLVCGLNIYESYEIQLALRELERRFAELQGELSLALAAIPKEEGSATIEALDTRTRELGEAVARLRDEIRDVDHVVASDRTRAFLDERKRMVERLNREKQSIRGIESDVERLSLELADLGRYIDFLEELSTKLLNTEFSSEVIGNIEFSYCPSCLSKLADKTDADQCVVCGSPVNPESERSKYLQIKLDVDIQLRESRQLRADKTLEISKDQSDLRMTRREYDSLLSEFSTKYDLSTSPRESYLAERHQRIGQMEREIEYLSRLRETSVRIQQLSNEKADVQRKISRLADRQKALDRQGTIRRSKALTLLSFIARALLAADLPRQDEFGDARDVTIDFRDDAVLVDGAMNFAESSNVVLKNTAILSIFSGATVDADFYHPRFVLLDNVEDKGMEPERSHNFQRLILGLSERAASPHQIIFTTSMINPDFEESDLVIGPHYTHEHKTLAIG